MDVSVQLIDPAVKAEDRPKPSWGGRSGLEESVSILECQDDFTLMESLSAMWNRLKQDPAWSADGVKPLKVSVGLNDLVPDAEHHLSLFENEKGLNVSKKLDEINAKFGRGSVYFASLGKSGELAPSRIAFQAIPDFESD